MKNAFRISLILPLLLLGLCLRAEIREITVFQTTDIHGSRDFARVVTALNAERAALPADHLLLIDCGDLTQGSMEAAIDHGASAIDALNAAKYDVFVPGNHDFEYGSATLIRNLQRVQAKVLCANLTLTATPNPVRNWAIFPRNGLRIAVIGCTIPHLDHWIPKELTKGVKLYPIPSSLTRILPEIRKAKPDIIILASHTGQMTAGRLGTDKKAKFLSADLRDFPEISLVLGGHTHQEVAGDILLKNTWFVQAPNHARGYAKITILYDTEKHKIHNISSQLKRVGEETPAAEISPTWTATVNQAERNKTEIIANVPFALAPLTDVRYPGRLALLFGEAIAAETNAPCAFSTTYSNREYVQPGNITAEQAFKLIPYENYICVLSLTPGQVKQIINEQLNVKQKDAALAVYGVTYRRAKGGKSVEGDLILTATGEPWTDEAKRIEFAFSSYAVCGGGGRYPVLSRIAQEKGARYTMTSKTVRDAFINLLKRKYPPQTP